MLSFPRAGATSQPTDVSDARQAREVARDLEALLVTQLITAMRKTVPESSMLESSAARRTLDGAFDHELARALVADGSLGFAKQLEGQLLARGGSAGSPTDASNAVDGPVFDAQIARVDARSERAGVVQPAASSPATSPVVTSPVVTRDPQAAPATRVAAAEVVVHPDAHRAGVALTPRPPLDEPRITSGFGMRVDPLTGHDRFHSGVDLGAARGTPIRVAADGQVVFSGRRGSAGNVVEVRHPDGLLTSYAHADRTLVGVGQNVVAGDVIATVGSTGRSTGPHLHFSVRRDGQAIDPTGFIPELRGEGRIG